MSGVPAGLKGHDFLPSPVHGSVADIFAPPPHLPLDCTEGFVTSGFGTSESLTSESLPSQSDKRLLSESMFYLIAPNQKQNKRVYNCE